MTAYLILSTLALFGLGVIWSREGFSNAAIKINLLTISVWGLVMTLDHLGYIVKGM